MREIRAEGRGGSSLWWRFLSLVSCGVWAVSLQYSGKGQRSDVSERWRPIVRGWLELWSERHCWNCSLWGWQKRFHCRYRPLPQYCSGLRVTGVLEECPQSEWGARWRRRRSWRRRKGFLEGHCCPLAAPVGLDHRHGGASPSLCVGRRSHSSELCCSRCTSRWLSSHNSSSFHWSLPAGWWLLAHPQRLASWLQPVPSPF